MDTSKKWFEDRKYDYDLEDYDESGYLGINKCGIAKMLDEYAKDRLIDFGIWLDKNDRHLENGNITENVNEYLKEKNHE